MSRIHRHTASVLLATTIVGICLLVLPLQAAFSVHEPNEAQGSVGSQGVVTSLSQATATLSLDPKAAAELRIYLLLTKPMVEITSQESCRVVTTLGYCTVKDVIQDSIDLEAHTVNLAGSESLKAWVDYTAGGAERSFEVSLTPKAGTRWGSVKGLQDVTIQATPI